MKSADEIVSQVEQIVDSSASRDEVLRHSVQILRQERELYNWVGIYLIEGETLVLHNYIGKPTEHTHIPVGKGVCGVAVAQGTNQIVGTDIEPNCLGAAENAVYGEAALGDTPAALREQYFQEVAGLFTVLPEVRRLVEFQRADLLQSKPPFDDVHLLVCRNVVIYLEREAKDALFAAFHRVLAPGGILVLGKVETLLGPARGLFSPVNARERIFRKL